MAPAFGLSDAHGAALSIQSKWKGPDSGEGREENSFEANDAPGERAGKRRHPQSYRWRRRMTRAALQQLRHITDTLLASRMSRYAVRR